MPGVRATKIETEKRIFTIQGWIIKGVAEYLILKNIESTYNVQRRQAKNLLKKAYENWVKEERATIEQKRAMRIAELKEDIRAMKSDYRGTPKGMAVVNNIKKEISKLENLYPERNITIKGDEENPIVVTDAESREARIKQLIEKAQT